VAYLSALPRQSPGVTEQEQ